jgi:hypothetical protein
MRIAFYGNHSISYTSESHHCASLEDLGCQVVRLQEPKCTAAQLLAEAEKSDCFVWVATHGWDTPGIEGVLQRLKQRGIPTLAYHLDAFIQIPDRWKKYQNHPTMQLLSHYFTVDQCLADWLNANTSVQGHYLPPGVFGRECYISDQSSPHANDVLFAGSYGYHNSYPMRPKLVDWLKSEYGPRFTHIGGGGSIGTVRGDELNRAYANSKVVIGDSYITDPNYPGKYWSDRVPESLGRGAFLLAPWVFGLDEHFTDGEHLVTYQHGNFDQLKFLIDYYVDESNTIEREQIRKAGHEHAKLTATYKVRWQQILDTVFG